MTVGQEDIYPIDDAIDGAQVANHIADMALDEEGITPSDASYHPARFAAIRAAGLAIDFVVENPPSKAIGKVVPLHRERDNDGYSQ